jgi:hypothetical protein
MTAWNEQHGQVTRAFDEWVLIDEDQRAFLRLALQFQRETYDRLWDETGRGPSDGDDDMLSVFLDKVEGLMPHDFEWMHLAAVLRDAVTSFEVYLEKAAEEALKFHGAAWKSSPRWGDLKKLFSQLGVQIDTADVRGVRDLRHFLTHQRGELRTDEQRTRFASSSGAALPAIVVELSEESVVAAMDVLAEAVRTIDVAAYKYSYGRARVPGLHPTACV